VRRVRTFRGSEREGSPLLSISERRNAAHHHVGCRRETLRWRRHEVEIDVSFTGDALVPWCRIVGFCTNEFGFSIKYIVHVH
jgi:hypothetical protein